MFDGCLEVGDFPLASVVPRAGGDNRKKKDFPKILSARAMKMKLGRVPQMIVLRNHMLVLKKAILNYHMKEKKIFPKI